MIIDCHGHYTTAPSRAANVSRRTDRRARRSVRRAFARRHSASATTRFARAWKARSSSCSASAARSHDLLAARVGDGASHRHRADQPAVDARVHDLIARVCGLYPDNFVGVCQLPQSPGVPPANSVRELERCVNELGFIGCNLNPDPSGGMWNGPPLTDRAWYPLYEKMVELDVPAMVHVMRRATRTSTRPARITSMPTRPRSLQFLTSDLFRDFPALRFVIPHGGGAVPYHWGAIAGSPGHEAPPPTELLLENVFFDTCVYHQPGIDLLLRVIPAKNILFGSELLGAVRGIDPETGHSYDDTKQYFDALDLSEETRRGIFETNAYRVYPRLVAKLAAR